ncbi:kinetochore protein Ndc80 [Haematobia irritans]|uniref:kinetochore protein Ndc80 n=1 Tax=Haematobia irritans TaxID=7368 RepID=UPI003F4FD864
MQRPRRTSEFHEDPNGIRRQSRQKSIAPSPGTASKFPARQSRIAVATRSASADRNTNAFLTVPGAAASSTKCTPVRLSKPGTSRVLFTAEKHRGGNTAASGPLHNDKKWVQEQSQRITEYLINQTSIGGISTDFLQKGLRQMSIKQFVAIVNFFLNHIWGKRYAVGNNHVEDISQILQKLQYPHPVSKSWLKTPNTQHSFGNVIVLLDYLMEFVPLHTLEDIEPHCIEYFELQDPQDVMNSSRMPEDVLKIPDLEFQRELLLNTEDGFMLWDTQKDEEFNALQKETCNLLISKTCNFPNSEAIEAEIEKMNEHLKAIQDVRPKEDKDLVRLHANLTEEYEFLNKDLHAMKEEHHNMKRNLKQLGREKVQIEADFEEMEKDVAALQEKIDKQLCTVEQRDQLMADLQHLEHLLAIEHRTLRDFENRNHNQQVVYARILKQFTDTVESFNVSMRQIVFSDLPQVRKISSEDLQLPLRPDDKLQNVIPLLKQIKEVTLKTITENKENARRFQEKTQELMDDIDTKLETKLTSLRQLVAETGKSYEKANQKLKNQIASLNLKLEQMENEILNTENSIQQLQQGLEEKRNKIHSLMEANESTMKQAEEEHDKHLAKRREFLRAYDNMLEETVRSGVLRQLNDQVELQERQLEILRKEFNKEEEKEN